MSKWCGATGKQLSERTIKRLQKWRESDEYKRSFIVDGVHPKDRPPPPEPVRNEATKGGWQRGPRGGKYKIVDGKKVYKK